MYQNVLCSFLQIVFSLYIKEDSPVFLLGRQRIGDASLQQEPLNPGQKGEGGLDFSPSYSLEGGGKAASCPYQGSPQPGCKISQVCLSPNLPAQRS